MPRIPLVVLCLSIPILPALAQSGPPPLPKEAFTACEAKKDGEACSVEFQGQKIEGTCVEGPEAKRFCLPAGAPRRGPL